LRTGSQDVNASVLKRNSGWMLSSSSLERLSVMMMTYRTSAAMASARRIASSASSAIFGVMLGYFGGGGGGGCFSRTNSDTIRDATFCTMDFFAGGGGGGGRGANHENKCAVVTTFLFARARDPVRVRLLTLPALLRLLLHRPANEYSAPLELLLPTNAVAQHELVLL